MFIRPNTLHRPLSALVLLALLLGLVAVGTPAYRAYADDEGFEETLFKSDFDSLSSGALTTAPLEVEVGEVLAAPAPAEVATVSGLNGKAIAVSGAGAVELRFSSYPGPLPQATNSQRYGLRVKAEIAAPAANVKGASLYLATAGGQRFEIVGFGADGKLARAGSPINLAYTANRTVQIEAFFDLKNRQLYLDLQTSAGSVKLSPISLPGGFGPDTVGRLIFAAGGATGKYGVDKVEIKVEKDDDDDREPPARIVITPSPSNNVTFEVVGDVTLVNFNIVLKNQGGRAKNVFLVLDVDDDLLDLLDLSWVSGVGYVKEIKDGQIVIGIGEYNAIRKDTYDLKFKFKLKVKRDGEIKLDIKYRVRYTDSGGARESDPLVIVIVVPVVIVPVTATPVATGSPTTNPYPAPGTATPTTTGTPATATPSATGTPPTATATGSPTVTGTPPTATATPPPATPSPTPTGGTGGSMVTWGARP